MPSQTVAGQFVAKVERVLRGGRAEHPVCVEQGSLQGSHLWKGSGSICSKAVTKMLWRIRLVLESHQHSFPIRVRSIRLGLVYPVNTILDTFLDLPFTMDAWKHGQTDNRVPVITENFPSTVGAALSDLTLVIATEELQSAHFRAVVEDTDWFRYCTIAVRSNPREYAAKSLSDVSGS